MNKSYYKLDKLTDIHYGNKLKIGLIKSNSSSITH